MDELEIGGKKYLSSRRAAKENKYHTDYIGQLIRAGKIVGKKVGRAWYVEEGSLNSYLKSESGTAPAAAMAAPAEVAQEVPLAPQIEEKVEEPTPEPEVMAPEIIEEEKIPIHTQQKIHVTLAEKNISYIQPKKNTLTYIEDTEPLLPVLEGRARANADFTPISLRRQSQQTETIYEEKEEEEITEESAPAKRFQIPSFRIARISTLAVVAVVTLAFFAGASVFVATSIKVKEGEPASVAFTIK